MNLSVMINLQIVLFLLIVAGIVLSRLGIITQAGRKSMTDVLIYFVLPCNIFMSYLGDISGELLLASGKVLIIAFGIQILSYLVSKLLYRTVPVGKKMVMRYGTICSNAGFIGLPVVEQLYGQEGLFLASVALVPLRIFMWSSGLSCFTQVNMKQTVKKLITHPCIIAVVLGFVMIFTGIELPAALLSTLKYSSSCTTALSMIIIGSILSEVDIKTVLNGNVLYLAVIRLLVIPAVSLLVLTKVFHESGLNVWVPVLLAAMPVGSTTAILAAKYDGDARFAAKCVFVTSVLSLITLPLISMMF